jgi:LysM repeat protein
MNKLFARSRRKWFATALVVLIVATAALSALPATAQGVPGCPIRITMFDALIIRNAPGYGSAVTRTLQAGEIVCMIGRNNNSTWVQLAYPNQQTSPVGWGPASAFTTTVPITVLPVTDGTIVTPPPTTPPPTTPPPGPGTTYVVQAGDNLFRIGQRFGLLWTTLAQANNLLPPYIIYVGQVLRIPGTNPTPTPPPVYRTYVVKQGDYLLAIARSYNLDWRTIASLNGIVYPWIILPGQTLRLPA